MLELYSREKRAEDITIDAAGSSFQGVALAYNPFW